MSALDFAARALAASLIDLQSVLFCQLNGRTVPDGIHQISSSGYDQTGIGAGTYICDDRCDESLLAAHPRLVFRTASGAIFRLRPENGVVTAEQAGASGDAGINDQPAIQAAIDYAQAVDAREVQLTREYYELWATLRTSPAASQFASDGHLLVIKKTLALRGVAGRRTILDCRALGGGDPETSWQTVPAASGDPGPAVWRGGGLFILGNSLEEGSEPLKVERIELHRLVFQGNRQRTAAEGSWPADPQTGDGWDISDKGFWVQDTHIGEVVMADTDFVGWKGELFYLAAKSARSLRMENCRLVTTNGGAFTPSCNVPTIVRDCEFGDAFLAWEETGKREALLTNCILRDSQQMSCGSGNASSSNTGHNFTLSLRDEASHSPQIRLESCEIRNIPMALIGSWVTGRVRTIDSTVMLDGTIFGRLQDVDLTIEASLDQQHGIAPLVLIGPVALDTQIAAENSGTFIEPPRNILVRLECRRTALAAAEGRHWHDTVWSGHVDPSCSLLLSVAEVAAERTPRSTDTPPKSFPLVRVTDPVNTTQNGAPASLWIGTVSASSELIPLGPICATAAGSEAVFDLTLPAAPAGGTEFGYADTQRFRLYKRADTGSLRFVAGAVPQVQLPQTRVLECNHDWIEFRWNLAANRWEECGFFTSA